MDMINVEGLDFAYEDKRVLHGIGFSVRKGSITALVGPNGAGKTTLLRCLAALEIPLNGQITIDGLDVVANPRAAQRRMGFLPDVFGLYDNLNVRQCLTFMAWCQKIAPDDVVQRVEEVAAQVGITGYLDTRAGALSRGYRQRAGIALALIHQPPLLLLDEPASGMDPEIRASFSRLMLDLRAQGMTMIVSSHILTELEDYCTDMLVIRDGRIIRNVSLKEHQAQAAVMLYITLTEDSGDHASFIAGRTGISDVQATGREVRCRFTGDETALQALLAEITGAGVPVCGFYTQQQTLHAAYMDTARVAEEV